MSVAVIACGAIATHISHIIASQGLDVTIYPLPPLLHNQPAKIAGEVEKTYLEIKDKHSKCAVAYADCGTYGALDTVIERLGLKRLGGNHCYDIFAGKEKIAALMESDAGTYFLTDFLVKSFHRSVIVELGLDKRPDLRDDYFKHYNKMIWLAQNPTSELTTMAQAAADLIGLELEIDVVGEGSLKEQILELLN
ncbi:MAG: DUF1638 domain-containing protein [Actinomycetes bacterium]|jgi:hypothetical protein